MMSVEPENLRKMHTEREHGAASWTALTNLPVDVGSGRRVIKLRGGDEAMISGLGGTSEWIEKKCTLKYLTVLGLEEGLKNGPWGGWTDR